LLIGYVKLVGHCSDCSSVSKKKVRSGEETKNFNYIYSSSWRGTKSM